MSDILDDIDALIDEQLDAGEAGAQRRAAEAERRCPHCYRAWHGLAITQRLERMRLEYQNRVHEARMRGEEPEYAESAILDGYRYAEDYSRVICPGSDFIGPMPAPPQCECGQCRALRGLIGDSERPGAARRDTTLGFRIFPSADELIGRAISFAGDLALDPSAWRNIGFVADGGLTPEPVVGEARGYGVDEIQAMRWSSPRMFRLPIDPGGPSRAERRHPDPESDAESESDDPPTSLADVRRRVRERGSRPQEHPIWAARMDGRRR